MEAVKGTWKNGQIVPDQPVEWPDGCRVVIEPASQEDKIGLAEDEWPTTPEARADWLNWFDTFEPVELSPAEEADWKVWRQKVKEYTIANMEAWS